MEMTPEKVAFIKGEVKAETLQLAMAKTEEKTIDIEPLQRQVDAVKDPAPRTTRRPSRRTASGTPDVSEVLDQVLVPKTFRIPHRTAEALTRVYLERKLNHVKPDTAQEIVEEALTDWLAKHRYLD